MSWFMATIYDRMCNPAEEAGLSEWRAELLSDLEGQVLEVGAGTGFNLPHYPESITHLVLSEPDRYMQRKFERNHAGHLTDRTEIVTASLDELPMADASYDAVVSTLVLCSVADPALALSEIWRGAASGRTICISGARCG